MKNWRKKFLTILAVFTFATLLFAEAYKVQIKGEVYVKTSDGDMIQLDPEKENITVELEDTIIVGANSKVTFVVNGVKIVIRDAGAYKVSDIVK